MSNETKKTSLTPHLVCRNAVEAMAFYEKAFGATTTLAMKMPNGQLMHGSMAIDGATFHVMEEFPEHGAVSPLTLGNSPVALHLQVADCDAVFDQAVEAGCECRMPLENMFWGDRYGVLADPYGHKWAVATTVREVSPEELAKAVANFAEGGCPEADKA